MFYKKRRNWKYRLCQEEQYNTSILVDYIGTDYITLQLGRLTIAPDYCWDGPSGPCFHNADVMRASLIHDALYQLMREGELSHDYREQADEIFRDICLKDGMSPFWANIMFKAVRKHGAKAIQSDVLESP